MTQVDCWTGRESRLLRESLRQSVRAFADELGVAARTIANWEAAGSAVRPRPDMQAILDTALRRAPDDARERFTTKLQALEPRLPGFGNDEIDGFKPLPASSTASADDLNRRDLLRLLSLAGALLATPQPLDWELIDNTSRRSGRLTPAALDEYERLNRYLWNVFGLSTTKAPMFPVVRAQLDVITGALQDSTMPDTRHRLFSLASDLFQLAGEILFDSNRYLEAGHCYTLAATAGREADRYDLWACALTRHAYISMYEGEFTQAEPLLQHAAVIARRGDPQLSTRHWVSSVQAQTFAGLGDRHACFLAIDQATDVNEALGNAPASGWLRFNGSRLAEEQGACLVSLGDAKGAEEALTSALNQQLSLRRRGAVLIDLASTGVLLRDTDRVIRYGEAALDVALETGSGAVRQKLLTFQRGLPQIPTAGPVQELGRRIEALRTASAS